MSTEPLAGVAVQRHHAESGRYAAALLFVHGLWTGPWIWRGFAGYLAHRGWECVVVDWHAGGRQGAWSRVLAAVQDVTASIQPAPIVIGHDLGATLALHVSGARAAVALAPLPTGIAARAHPVLGSAAARWARLRRRPVIPTPLQASRALGLDAPPQLVAEAGTWSAELAAVPAPPRRPGDSPALLALGDADVCAPPRLLEPLAAALGADARVYPNAGHALPIGVGWQLVASDMHRWLVQNLGPSLLRLRGDEDLRDD